MVKDVLIEVKDLTKVYGSGEGATVALDNIDCKIYSGELLVILGSSGSGKSTLLNMIGGMDAATDGKIVFDGIDICKLSEKELTNFRKNEIGFIFQSFNLVPELTALENVALTADTDSNANSIDMAFESVSMTEKMNRYPRELAGGEQQRVSIARALAKKSRILLCDEPTGALDFESGRQVLIQLEKLAREEGKTVVIVTHTKEIGKMADRILRMRNGKIIKEYIIRMPNKAESIEW